jgi:dethiobiotin synthetase
VIAEATGAHYWKPVQAGVEERDTETVKRLLTNGERRVHAEAVLLQHPLSPHAAAAMEGRTIDHTQFSWPDTQSNLLVETAGGLLSPMSDTATMADFIAHYKLPLLLVVQHYLGSINHTLMTLEVIRSRGLELRGMIICGEANEASESFIEQYARQPVLCRIPHLRELNSTAVAECAAAIKNQLVHLF